MGAFLIDALETNNARNQADAVADAPSFEYKPGFMEGAASAVGTGLSSGAAKAVLFLNSITPQDAVYGDPVRGRMMEEATGYMTETEKAEAKEASRRLMTETVKSLRPDARTTGVAGQVLFSLADMIPRTALATAMGGPIAGAVAAGAPEGYATSQVAQAEGVDPATANLMGITEGLATGAGALLPGSNVVKARLADLGLAVGGNVGLGMIERAAVGSILDGAGYGEMAQQYDAWDARAMLTDAVLGTAFWGVSRLGNRGAAGEFPKPEPAQVDAALADVNARHVQVDSAPALPADLRAAEAHFRTMEAALRAVWAGEPVRVDPLLESATFVRPRADESPLARQMRDDYADMASASRLADLAEPVQPDVPFTAPVAKGAETAIATREDGGQTQAPADRESGAQAQADPLAGNHIVQAARQAVERMPDLPVRIVDEAGNEQVMSAKAWMDKVAGEDIQAAQQDAKAIPAAVQCFLGAGL